MASTTIAEAAAWNISGEIPGSGDEVIVVGGHLDSWDPGEGAVDDGAGVSVTVGAAKVIGESLAQHHLKPKRTIRVVLFGSEETGGSSDAYEKAHAGELAKIAMTAESDTGAGRILKVQLPANAASDPALS